MARQDQERGARGQYGPASTATARHDDETLHNVISTKVTSSELRMFSIMFDQVRKQFGWQTMSDMYRDLLREGYKTKSALVRHPTAEMRRTLRQVEELERIDAEAARHRALDRIMERVYRDVEETMQTGDLAAVRRMLVELRAKTEAEDDPAIKLRRQMEFDRRYGNIWSSLNRGTSLVQFEDE